MAALLLAPAARALDELPGETRLGAREARVVVHVAAGSRAIVAEADAPARAAVGRGNASALPATLPVPEGAAWHGLPDVVELRLERDDATRAVEVELADGSGTGVTLAWHAADRRTGGPGVLLLAAAAAGACRLRR
jgi:hypothetical protein